jgi:hypothetical protein
MSMTDNTLLQHNTLAKTIDDTLGNRRANRRQFANMADSVVIEFTSDKTGFDAHSCGVFLTDYLNDRYPCKKSDDDDTRQDLKSLFQALNRCGEDTDTHGGIIKFNRPTAGKNAAGIKRRKVKVEFTSNSMLYLPTEQAKQTEKLQAEQAAKIAELLQGEHEKAIMAMTPAEIVAELTTHFDAHYGKFGHELPEVLAEWKYQLTEHAATAKDGDVTSDHIVIENGAQVVNG